jgi:MFS transporter, DHA2 family, methylenomycin A resistance protein
VGLFTVGTLGAALAPTFPLLVLARLVQGVATSLFMTASLSVVSTAYADRRAWAIGMWSAIGSTAAATAPVVGGLVVDGLGWRWFFALNLPLLVVSLVMILRHVPESTGDERPIDLVGAVLVTASISLVVFGLQEAGNVGWTDPRVLVAGASGVLVFAVFVVQQRRSAVRLVDAAITRARGYRPPVAVAFLANWGFGAINILLTFWLQQARGESAAMTGVVFLAYSVPFAVLGAATGRVVGRAGTRLPMIAGMALISGSFLVLTQLGATSAMWVVLVAMALSGVGQGLAYNVSTTAAMASVPDEHAGVASGLLTAVRNVGVAAGVAVATLATASPSGEAASATDFTSGLRTAAWVIVAVSMAGCAIALTADRRVTSAPGGVDGAVRSG